ncbi:MAG: WecB/TagA/CpsF family glycosyltransferase [Alphaproteobacteria bacterium]|nr:WecB/TagA/CpsF family glycosyltransferase [Alphaproteobacteria bacterium]
MIDRGKRNVLGIGVDVIDYAGAVARILDAATAGRPLMVSALAVHGAMTGVFDRFHRYRLNQFGLIVPDGQPLRWALDWLHGEKLGQRVYGPELMQRVCAASAEAGVPIYLYGSRDEVLDPLETNLRRRYPALIVAGRSASRFRMVSDEENRAILAEIRATRPGIVFVGLGCPRQEVFAFENAEALGCPVIAVGAAFDFHAGLLRQAPAWMQDRGLEWLFRLTQEPGRLWKRYLLLNPAFCWNLIKQIVRPASFEADRGQRPDSRSNYA